mmetsp:Transcript_30688/g.70737  ORF Transcript_30688/g.70737 Transcript_30688/m.70737 type:complete len:225 (+) Transcript_30688:520-1194(+)
MAGSAWMAGSPRVAAAAEPTPSGSWDKPSGSWDKLRSLCEEVRGEPAVTNECAAATASGRCVGVPTRGEGPAERAGRRRPCTDVRRLLEVALAEFDMSWPRSCIEAHHSGNATAIVSNASCVRTYRWQYCVALMVAVRRSWKSRDSSPKKSPGCSVATLTPSLITAASPRARKNMSDPYSPWQMMSLVGWNERLWRAMVMLRTNSSFWLTSWNSRIFLMKCFFR